MPPQWRCSPHQSAKVSSLCLRAKDHLEGTKVAVFPCPCAPQKVQTGSAADWRSPKSGDREDDGRPDDPRRGRRPRDGRWWDTDGVRPKSAPVQASAVALHDDTGRGSRVKIPPAQPLQRLRVSSFSLSARHAWRILDGHRTMDAVVIIGTLPLCTPEGRARLP